MKFESRLACLALLALPLASTGCKEIPEAYLGSFSSTDSSLSIRIDKKSIEVSRIDSNGRPSVGYLTQTFMGFKKIYSGIESRKQGIYLEKAVFQNLMGELLPAPFAMRLEKGTLPGLEVSDELYDAFLVISFRDSEEIPEPDPILGGSVADAHIVHFMIDQKQSEPIQSFTATASRIGTAVTLKTPKAWMLGNEKDQTEYTLTRQ